MEPYSPLPPTIHDLSIALDKLYNRMRITAPFPIWQVYERNQVKTKRLTIAGRSSLVAHRVGTRADLSPSRVHTEQRASHVYVAVRLALRRCFYELSIAPSYSLPLSFYSCHFSGTLSLIYTALPFTNLPYFAECENNVEEGQTLVMRQIFSIETEGYLIEFHTWLLA